MARQSWNSWGPSSILLNSLELFLHRRVPPAAPFCPKHPHPPSNPIVDGRLWALWAPSHFPAAMGLGGLLSPERAGDTRPSSLARPFLLCLLETAEVIQGEIGPASSLCLPQDLLTVAPIPVERGTPCAAAWHATRGAGAAMTADPGYPPTKFTVLIVYIAKPVLLLPSEGSMSISAQASMVVMADEGCGPKWPHRGTCHLLSLGVPFLFSLEEPSHPCLSVRHKKKRRKSLFSTLSRNQKAAY